MAKAQINMTEGPILGKMIVFTIPVMLTGMLQLLFNAADLVVVGQFVGPEANAAVGCCGALINLIVNLFMGLSVGAGVIAAQDIGARRYDEVLKLISTSMTVSIVGGVAVGALGFFAARPLLVLMGTPDDVLVQAVPYMRAYFCGMPGCLMYNYLASILRSKGDTTHPLIFLTIAGVANVILNVVMVAAFSLGAVGVGIATAASQYIAAGLTVYHMLRKEDLCRITGFRVYSGKFVRMLVIGLPSGLQGMLFSLSNVLIQSTINGYGKVVMAGNANASNLDGFQYTAMNSVYHAALTFVGQNVGAGTYKRLKRIMFDSAGLVTAIGIVIGVLLIGFGKPLLSLYSSGAEKDAVVQAGMNRLWILATTYFLCGLMDVGCGLLRGMGRVILPMIVSLLGSCVFRIIWIYTVCPLYPENIAVLYASYPISWFLTAGVHFICCVYFYRKLMKKCGQGQSASPASEL
ncbi:MAG: MATE family efflux transporter [Clostridia bacterium]|nr:MATE family efflux transporter [Clostridia bacterium]